MKPENPCMTRCSARCVRKLLSLIGLKPMDRPTSPMSAMANRSKEGPRCFDSASDGASASPRRSSTAAMRGQRAESEMLMNAGANVTKNNAGKMQNTIGNSILTGAFMARSWAI